MPGPRRVRTAGAQLCVDTGEVMNFPRPAALLLAGVVALTGCEEPLQEESEEQGDGGPPQGVSDMEASAPNPTGDQHSHEDMREALEGTIDDAELSDSDDLYPSIRDINRELQKLVVEPTTCKSFVTTSAMPVPSGALAAFADHAPRQTSVHSFEDSEAAGAYIENDIEGLDSCDSHTVVRDLGEDEVEAETELSEVDVESGAENAVAVHRSVDDADGTEHDLAVVLRHGAVVVSGTETLDDSPSEDDAEELAVDLEAEAASVLSDLVGEEITAPEPEENDAEDDSEDDSEEENDAEDDGTDEDGSDEDTDAEGDSPDGED